MSGGKINSRAKGGRFERAVLTYLKERTGIRGRRTSDGYDQSGRGDIEHPLLHRIHSELKHREQIALRDWIKQAEDDSAGTGRQPIVIWRTNSIKARVDLTLEHFVDLLLNQKEDDEHSQTV